MARSQSSPAGSPSGPRTTRLRPPRRRRTPSVLSRFAATTSPLDWDTTVAVPSTPKKYSPSPSAIPVAQHPAGSRLVETCCPVGRSSSKRTPTELTSQTRPPGSEWCGAAEQANPANWCASAFQPGTGNALSHLQPARAMPARRAMPGAIWPSSPIIASTGATNCPHIRRHPRLAPVAGSTLRGQTDSRPVYLAENVR